ncbi:MAG: hypothetical protein K0R14_164 [Burkholderiales bacterium]|jgi:hypothetical protein|nr:hypothetical protein [Burkholderiales bacterium]
MFELKSLLQQAQKLWDNQIIFREITCGETLFPLHINLPMLSSRALTNNFIQIKSEVQRFIESCKLYNIKIIFKEINHRQFGLQRLPRLICFTTLNDYLHFVGKEREYKLFNQTFRYIINKQPRLRVWLIEHSHKILEYQKKWSGLLKVCDYFLEHSRPNKYIRELEITGIDSKFIEQHKSILTLLLNELLLVGSLATENNIGKRNEFERRFGLKYIEPTIRFRILDDSLVANAYVWHKQITDYTIPLGEFIKLNIPCDRIFITENKINGLSFPKMDQSIIIFGLGYGIEMLKNIPWFENKEIIYWGDIDTHGFAILSQLRSYYFQVKSILMDISTLNLCKDLWVCEPIHTRCTAQLQHLTSKEQELYRMLLNNELGEYIRLEQERISYHYLIKILEQTKVNKDH